MADTAWRQHDNHGWLHTDRAVHFEGVWPILIASSHGSITTMDCAQSGMQCNFNYLQCLGRVGPEF